MRSINLHKSFDINGSFELDNEVFNELLLMKHNQIMLTVPLSGVEKQLVLKRNFINIDSTRVQLGSLQINGENNNVHYGGRVDGSEMSFVAISFTEHGIYGIIEDNFVEYGFNNNQDGTYYLSETPPYNEPWVCENTSIDDSEPFQLDNINSENIYTSSSTTKCVYIRWDVDYDVIQRFGSTGATFSYIEALFNAQQQLYLNEGIKIYLNNLVFYVNGPSGFQDNDDELNDYSTYLNSINFQGSSSDCAQFLYYGATPGGGSGSAWRPGLCNFSPTQPNVGPYGQSRMKYSDGDIVPSSVVYSRTVKVNTHELGHILGCHHTFACQWNTSWVQGDTTFGTQRIDGSGGNTYNPQEGSCFVPPIEPGYYGTIMGYCDSTGLCPVSFALGFGPIPRQRMIDRINSTSCTTTCSEPLPTPAPTNTSTPTVTKTPTKTKTPFLSPNPTSTPTKSQTSTQVPSVTQTPTVTNTQTQTPNLPPTQTPTNTKTQTLTPTRTQTQTMTSSLNSTPNPTPTRTTTLTSTVTKTLTPTNNIYNSTIIISSNNFNGLCGNLVFYPSAGGTVNIGLVCLPYTFSTNDICGDYIITFTGTNQTCEISVCDQTPTPTPTQTPTPTVTKCCSRFTLSSSPNDLTGSTFYVTNCDGSNQFINVPFGTSQDINCANSVLLFAGLGSFIRYPGCVCTTPTPTPTKTNPIPLTPTPSKSPTPTPFTAQTQCEYCISLHPCTINKFFDSCCEPFDTYRIYLIPFDVANNLVDGQTYFAETVGFSGCVVYNASLSSATYSYQYINISNP